MNKRFIALTITAIFLLINITGCMILGENEQKDEENSQSRTSQEQNSEGKPAEEVIAEFSTPIKDNDKKRMKNITLSIEQINGKIINPGEVFSFNEIVGKRTMEKGYQKAIIFRNKQKVKEVGGGICQVSTTIYNAAMIAGMEIVERHEHELDVPYIEKGKDATVSYGSLDLKFKNTSEYPIKVISEVTEDSVISKIIIIK